MKPISWDNLDLDALALATHKRSHPKLHKGKAPKLPDDAYSPKPAFSRPKKSRFSFIDLFAGIGGFRLAGNNVGGDCIFTSEWDKYARRAYFLNYGEVPFGDITKFTDDKTKLNKIPKHDVLCGGFPCQAFSISGKQAGFKDPRGTLFFEVYKIAKYHRPKVLFLENVKNFARHDNGKTFETVKHYLEVKMHEETQGSCSYLVSSAVLNASNFGATTKRERIYIVAVREDIAKKTDWEEWKTTFLKLNKVVAARTQPLEVSLQKNSDIEPWLLKKVTINRKDIKLKKDTSSEITPKPVRVGILGKGGQGERIYSTQGHAITFSAYGGGAASKTGAYLIEGKVRKLTPKECANCMGFSGINMDLEAVPLVQRYKQFGNSVVVNVVEAIFGEIARRWLSKPVRG
jgi:DNA (cytosine-5)-methyltransferase 1